MAFKKSRTADFAGDLLKWQPRQGRHDLPWQKKINPYRVWVSEIMLQQTQVKTVIPYFNRFVKKFPDIKSLATARLDDVLHLWTGLGYYARARNLHQAAKLIIQNHKGRFPDSIAQVQELPGIGRSTAGAILALACGQRHPILDGNVKRVLARYHLVAGWPGQPEVEAHLWQLAEQHLPPTKVAEYTQAIMDLGATVCTRHNPGCECCPVRKACKARLESRQHEFPEARPRKRLPVRQSIFAIVQNQRGEILLQQRPPAGIWGGLWSFPECEPDADLKRWIKSEWGYTMETLIYKLPIRHTFSHFHLDITPVHIRIRNPVAVVRDSADFLWYRPGSKRSLGLAAPVSKLLSEVCVSEVN